MKANQMDTPIENIYVAGIKGIDMDSYRTLTGGSRIEAKVDWFDCGLGTKVNRRFDLTTVLPALGGLLGQVKSNNMLSNYSSKRDGINLGLAVIGSGCQDNGSLGTCADDRSYGMGSA